MSKKTIGLVGGVALIGMLAATYLFRPEVISQVVSNAVQPQVKLPAPAPTSAAAQSKLYRLDGGKPLKKNLHNMKGLHNILK